LEQGLPMVHRAKLDAENLAPEARLLVARALMRSGQLYWRAADFESVAAFLKDPVSREDAHEAKLLVAVADALKRGPADPSPIALVGTSLHQNREVIAHIFLVIFPRELCLPRRIQSYAGASDPRVGRGTP